MTTVDHELHELAGIRSDADPVVSVHLDTRWSDEQQRERVRLFVQDEIRKLRPRGRDGDAKLGRTLDRIEEHVEGLVRQAHDTAADGVAIFACEGLGLFHTVEVHRSFAPSVRVGDAPFLVPLAAMASRFRPVAIAIADAHGARVIETELGSVTGEAAVLGRAHRRHAMGGWSQRRYQNHIRRQIQRNHEAAAEHLDHRCAEDPRLLVAVAGPDRVLADFQRVLPPRVAARVFFTMGNPRERSDREAVIRDEVLERTFAELVSRDIEEDDARVRAAIGEAAAGGLASLGADEVCRAVGEGRVHALLLAPGERKGWRCRRCEAVGAQAVASCTYCGGELTTVDLGAELARRTLLAGGRVQVVERPGDLAEHDGLGAVLRHRGTEEAGASLQPGAGTPPG